MSETSPAGPGASRRILFFAACLVLAELSCIVAGAASHFIFVGLPYIVGNKPLPHMTELLRTYSPAIPYFPVPWLVAALALIIRGRVTASQQLMFLATLVLSLIFMLLLVALGCACLWIPVICG